MSPKIPLDIIGSDDCAIMVGRVVEKGAIKEPGTPYYVHKGEWVKINPVRSVRELIAINTVIQAANDGVAKGFDVLKLVCEEVAKRMVEWNWTDLEGRPLPQPHNNPDVLQDLSDDELMWLISAVKGETGGQRKNEFSPSPNTS